MATLYITTNHGENIQSTSHVVGYESGRFRHERFKFRIPKAISGKNIFNAKLIQATTAKIDSTANPGTKIQHTSQDCAFGGGVNPTVYFRIQTQPELSQEIGFIPHGTVSFSEDFPKLSPYSAIPLETDTDYYLIVYTTVSQLGWRYFPNTQSRMALSLTIDYVSYTNCGAPTKVTASAYCIPGRDLTVSWSGETAGIENAIKQYNFWYKFGTGAWSKAEVRTSSSATIKIPSDKTRGTKISVKIQTVGSVDGYNSSEQQFLDISAINKKPNKPTVIVVEDSLNVPHGDSRTITATVGTDPDGSDCTIWYKIDGGTLTKGTDDTLTFTVKSKATYTFYTYDGWEYSDPVEKKFNFSSGKLYLTLTDKKNGQLSRDITATGQYGIGVYTYTFEILKSFHENKEYTSVYTSTTSSSNTFKIEDIRNRIAPSERDQYYKIQCTCKDGVETDIISSIGPYVIHPVPSIGIKNDKTPSPTLITTNGTYFFSNEIKIEFNKTEGYDRISLLVRNASNADVLTRLSSTTQDGDKSFVEFDLTDLPRGSQYKFYCAPCSSTYIPTRSHRGTATRIYLPSFDNISVSKVINPYFDTSVDITFRNFLGTTDIDNKLSLYGLEKSDGDVMASIKSTISTTQQPRVDNKSISWSSSSDTAKITLSDTDIKTLFNDVGNKTSAVNVPITLSISTIYGDTITNTSNNCWINFGLVVTGSEPAIDSVTLTYSYNGSNITPNCIGPGFTINISPTFNDNLKHSLVAYEYEILNSSGNLIYKTSGDCSIDVSGSSTYPEFKLPSTHTEIKNPSLRIRYKTAAQYWMEYYTNIIKPIRRVETMDMVIKDVVSIENNSFFKVTFEVRDLGVEPQSGDDFTFDVCLITEKDEKEDYIVLSDEMSCSGEDIKKGNYSITFDTSKVSEVGDVFKIRVYCARQIYYSNELKPNIGYNHSPIFLVYKISPTLSYRRNKVGINYSFPDNSSITNPSFVVGTHSTAKNVYFIDTANNQIASIDLETGAMNGFIIDGGSW